jgi:hypothetical protein
MYQRLQKQGLTKLGSTNHPAKTPQTSRMSLELLYWRLFDFSHSHGQYRANCIRHGANVLFSETEQWI